MAGIVRKVPIANFRRDAKNPQRGFFVFSSGLLPSTNFFKISAGTVPARFAEALLELLWELCIACFIIANCTISYAQEETVAEEIVPEETVEATEPQQTPTEMIPAQPPIGPDTLLWIEDNLPEGATAAGEWIWVEDVKFSGSSSHTDGIKKGLHSHSFKTPIPVTLKKDSVIEQFVYLDPDNPPKGIMLKLITLDGEKVDFYWEAEEEVFVDTVEYMEAWYMGFLPEPGSWQTLVININELEIAPVELIGISFISYDGRAYWDKTLIRG